MSRLRILALVPSAALALLASLGGCAATPSGVNDAKALRVTYWDFKTDTQLAIVNESDPQYADIYNHPRNNADVKRAPDDQLKQLVSFAGDKDFFDHSESIAGPNDTIRATGYRMIVINADGKDYAFVLSRGLGEKDPGAVKNFTEIQTAFLQLYNSVPAFQYLGSADGSFFDQQQKRLQDENAKRTQKSGNR